MKFLVLILAVVATAYAQSKCSTTPETWFGYFREIGWDADKPGDLIFRIANASYDRTNKVMKIMDVDVGPFGADKTVQFLDYKNGEKYTVIKGKCEKESLSGSIPSFGVPSGAQYESSEFIGSSLPKLGVLVDEFNEVDRDKKTIYLGSYAPVTGDTCIPVLVSSLVATPKLGLDLQYFANLTTTIPPGGLTMPPECRHLRY